MLCVYLPYKLYNRQTPSYALCILAETLGLLLTKCPLLVGLSRNLDKQEALGQLMAIQYAV